MWPTLYWIYWTMPCYSVQLVVDSVHFLVGIIHLGFIDIHVHFSWRGLMAFIIFSKGRVTKEKQETAVKFVDSSPNLCL